MCLLIVPKWWITPKIKAIYGWVESFWWDYLKYLDALYEWDEEKIEEFLQWSKKYYDFLENKLLREKWDLAKNSIFDDIYFQISKIINKF